MMNLDIAKMTVPERIQAMEQLWDSLSPQESEIESPQWHWDILDERVRKIENGTAEFIALDELASLKK